MDITTERAGADLTVIALSGELDGSNFESVIAAARAARDGGSTRIVLDLGGLTYMASSGLVAIHSIALLLHGQEPTSPEDGWQAIHDIGARSADDADALLILAAPPPAIHRVLDRSGMLSLFPVHDDRAAAVAAASA